jgi:hypothetical protein
VRIELLIKSGKLVARLIDSSFRPNDVVSESSIDLKDLAAALPQHTFTPTIDGDIYVHSPHKTSPQVITREENEAQVLAERKNTDTR